MAPKSHPLMELHDPIGEVAHAVGQVQFSPDIRGCAAQRSTREIGQAGRSSETMAALKEREDLMSCIFLPLHPVKRRGPSAAALAGGKTPVRLGVRSPYIGPDSPGIFVDFLSRLDPLGSSEKQRAGWTT